MPGPVTLMTTLDRQLAELSARANDCRAQIGRASGASSAGSDDATAERMASASRMFREVEAMAANIRQALTHYGVNETLREARTGGQNVRPLRNGPHIIVDNASRQPDDPGPCVA